MELDAKQQVLMAIYGEYQRDLPDMRKVSCESLDVGSQVFRVAASKLQNEGLICGLAEHTPKGQAYPSAIDMRCVRMTREGIDFVENKLEIDKGMTGREKVEELARKCSRFGWDALSDFVAKVLVEMASQYSVS